MADNLFNRISNAWNAFNNKNENYISEPILYSRPDRNIINHSRDRSTINTILNRIAIDVSMIQIKHCRLDDNNRYIGDIDSKLNNCLNLESNIDQTSRNFIQDLVLTILDKGHAVIVPTDTTSDPNKSDSYDIIKMRVGVVTEWYPSKVKVKVYNENTGQKEEKILDKKIVGIIENPLYSILNDHNSTLQRLIRKITLLDTSDERVNTGKLDLIIQLPYVIKSDLRKKQAEERRLDIEQQLASSSHGIAYTDGTEKITQLNRPVENNLQKQIEYLTSTLYAQLGITTAVMDGTANEQVMLNYYSRTIDPILTAIVAEIKRKFLSKTARTQGQTILYFRDPFRLVTVSEIAKIADIFTRNEILTSNEIRQLIGLKPSDDPKADKLLNSNINPSYEYEDNTYYDETDMGIE